MPASAYPAEPAAFENPETPSLLIESLIHGGVFTEPVELIETHISWVILSGEFAYKIKKPVHFQFADLQTLEQRRQACCDELKLNSQLAPDLYLDVVEITGSDAHPELGGKGPVIEYAVRMKRIDQSALLTHVLERGELTAELIDDLADQVGVFHCQARVVAADDVAGSPQAVEHDVLSNFDELVPYLSGEDAAEIHMLRKAARHDIDHLKRLIEQRKSDGFVRECHGDMHLGNMFLSDGRVIIFDGIDFNRELRCIDIMNEVAFVMMDLEYRGRGDLAMRFLNRWLEWTGDYDGLDLLPFYLTYRAVVRAKVETLQSQTPCSCGEKCRLQNECSAHLHLASRYANRRPPVLMITHGPSGSGKTTGTQMLIEQYPAIRIRSDVERKRLNGLAPHETSAGRIYDSGNDRATYDRLRALAGCVLESGYSCVVDATFHNPDQRAAFRDLADEFRVPFFILPFTASRAELEERITARQRENADASEATVSVMEMQLADFEPPQNDEARFVTSPESLLGSVANN